MKLRIAAKRSKIEWDMHRLGLDVLFKDKLLEVLLK